MAIAILVGRSEAEAKAYTWFTAAWKQALLAFDPSLDIRIWPELGDHQDISVALVWKHPIGILTQFPHLQAIMSLAAGVDHVLTDSNIPKNIPLARVMDPYMANEIVQYVLVTVLNYVKRMEAWAGYQLQKRWMKVPPFNHADKTIGIMGLGFLGEKAARMLSQIGLNVIGWRNSSKQLPEIKSYYGKEQFSEFLSQTDILVCMLPLTPETENILNKDNFAKLKKGAYLINLGRGEHLVEKDLLDALEAEQLVGACLDVFRQEPLPEDHPFWINKKIRVTPHVASVTNAATAAPQVYSNYRRVMAGEVMQNLVSIEKGY